MREHKIIITIREYETKPLPTKKDITIQGFNYLIYPVKKLIIELLKEKLK